MRPFYSVTSALLLAVALPGTATAQQEGAIILDTIRVLGSRVSADLPHTTRQVQVWTREEIQRMPVRTVSDLLAWSTGVDLAPRSAAQADVSIRGAGFEQVLVLVDGVRMSDPQTGHFDLDLAVPLERVERVEILRGPASALYGSDAVGGVVNVVTRRDAEWTGRVEGGSFGTAQGAIHGGLTLAGDARLEFAGELGESDGHREGTDWEQRMATATLRVPAGGGRVTGSFGWARRAFGADAFYAPFPSFETTRTRTAELGWTSGVGRIQVEPRIHWRSHGDDFILDRADPSFYRNRHTSSQIGGELVLRWAPARGLGLSGGIEGAHHRLRSETLGDPERGRRTEGRRATFGELALRKGPLDVNAGLRYDDHDRWGGFASPSLALGLEARQGLRLRGSVGRAFRGPTWTERHYVDPAHVARDDLAPERSTAVEAGVDVEPADGVTLAATLFHRTSRDLIDWARPADDPDAMWRTTNVTRATFRGLEGEVRWEPDAATSVDVGASWLSVDADVAEGLESKYALQPLAEQAHLGVARAFPGGVRISVRGTRARRVGGEPYEVLDARAELSLLGVGLFLDGRNLTDSDHLDLTDNPVAGRAFHVGVTVGS